MGKSKPPPRKKEAPTTRKPVDARVTYLYQAAKYFAGIKLDSHSDTTEPGLDPLENHQNSTASASGPVSVHSMDIDDKSVGVPTPGPSNLSSIYDKSSIRILLSHMRGVSRKGPTSIPSAIKRSGVASNIPSLTSSTKSRFGEISTQQHLQLSGHKLCHEAVLRVLEEGSPTIAALILVHKIHKLQCSIIDIGSLLLHNLPVQKVVWMMSLIPQVISHEKQAEKEISGSV
ncbi:MAG: hypothetical protein Q9172_007781 [Xanthocarpia lactea]